MRTIYGTLLFISLVGCKSAEKAPPQVAVIDPIANESEAAEQTDPASLDTSAGDGKHLGENAPRGAKSGPGKLRNPEATVARLRPGFKMCYTSGLQSNPKMSGKVNFQAKIGPTGAVESVGLVKNVGLSPQVVSCVSRKIRSATFDAPGGSGSSLEIPVSFVQQ